MGVATGSWFGEEEAESGCLKLCMLIAVHGAYSSFFLEME
jgi:hypothetical protein